MDLGLNGAVKGGSDGIGLAIVERFEGVNLVLDAPGAERVREEMLLTSSDADFVVAQTLMSTAARG